MSVPLVSVVLPTYRRDADLLDAARSLLLQDYPRFEVIVVDNNGTDCAAGELDQLVRREARLRRVHEPRPGVNAARNRGSLEAQGDLLAFLDDDGIAPRQWLTRLVAAQAATAAGAVGGPYEPLWLAQPPRWLLASPCMRETLSFMDFGSAPREVEWLLGGNALYTRQALQDANYFGVRAGRTGVARPVGGGDIAAGARLRHAGHRLWFEPTAVVYHKVPPERMRLSYVLRRAFWAGYNDVMLGRPWPPVTKARRALRRGPDALVVGAAVIPGLIWGRLMVRLGCLQAHSG